MKNTNKLDPLLHISGPLLAAAVDDSINTREISFAMEQGLDIAELRIDLCSQNSPMYVLNQIEKLKEIATVATIRTAQEGGKWNGSEQERLTLFKSVIPHVDAIDIESSASDIIGEVVQEAKQNNVHVIVSYHNFDTTPSIEELRETVAAADERNADIIKVATQINNDDDIKKLTTLLLEHGNKRLIVIGMGAKGTITRLAFPAYGSVMTFCKLTQSTASGQLGLKEMSLHLRKYYPQYNQRVIIDNETMECV